MGRGEGAAPHLISPRYRPRGKLGFAKSPNTISCLESERFHSFAAEATGAPPRGMKRSPSSRLKLRFCNLEMFRQPSRLPVRNIALEAHDQLQKNAGPRPQTNLWNSFWRGASGWLRN